MQELMHVTVNVMSKIITRVTKTQIRRQRQSLAPWIGDTVEHALRRPLTQMSLSRVQAISELGLRRVLKGNQNRFCVNVQHVTSLTVSFVALFPPHLAVFSSGSGAVGSRRDFLAVSDGGQAVL